MTACYTDRISVAPGEGFTLHASADGPCRLAIARVGAARQLVFERDGIRTEILPVREHADRDGCGWPVALRIDAGADWASGYYDIVLSDRHGGEAHHFICVRPRPGAFSCARAALVLSTNTWQAYNYFGGANAYCDVGAAMARRMRLSEALNHGIGRLSALRPFPRLLLAPPPDAPRQLNLRKRGFKEPPWLAADPEWSRAHGQVPFDGSAGFLNKWEHFFAAWAEEEDIALDYLTDSDLDRDARALDGHACAVFVGHSEYWSGPERDVLDCFVDRGGKLAIFSGNTAFWKVRWDGDTLVCHKWRGETAECVAPADATHLWSHPMFNHPEAALTGLSFAFGGYHRSGLCAARGQGGYTVYRPEHWALAGTDLFYGDVMGDDVPILGYENDGCRIAFDADGLPVAVPGLGVPATLEIAAIAPCSLSEPPDSTYRPVIPPERIDVLARIALGDDGPAAQRRMLRGHAVMGSFARGAGEVFNAGTTEWAHGLAARNPFVTRITRNVLERFGAC